MTYRYHSEDPIKRRKLTLTEEQLHELKCYFVNDYVNDLSVNELKDIVYGNLIDCMRDYTIQEVKNECDDCMRKGYFWELYHQVLNTNQKEIEDPW